MKGLRTGSLKTRWEQDEAKNLRMPEAGHSEDRIHAHPGQRYTFWAYGVFTRFSEYMLGLAGLLGSESLQASQNSRFSAILSSGKLNGAFGACGLKLR